MNKEAMELSTSLKEQVLSRVDYPATKAKILKACNTSETPAAVLRAAEVNLRDKVYRSADEVLKDLELQ